MAKLKMLKMPKKPKLSRKPKASSSLETKERWLASNKKKLADYSAKKRAVEHENSRRKTINGKNDKLAEQISRISGIEGLGRVSHTTRRKAAKKAAPKRKAAKRRPAKKAARRRHR